MKSGFDSARGEFHHAGDLFCIELFDVAQQENGSVGFRKFFDRFTHQFTGFGSLGGKFRGGNKLFAAARCPGFEDREVIGDLGFRTPRARADLHEAGVHDDAMKPCGDT